MPPIAPPRTPDDPFAGILPALDAALVRLQAAGVTIGHGIWHDGNVRGRRLQLARGDHLLIATALPHPGQDGHDPPCRPATGQRVLRLLEPDCMTTCPGTHPTPSAFVAMRLARALAAAAGESPERIRRLITHAPSLTQVSPGISLCETLFA